MLAEPAAVDRSAQVHQLAVQPVAALHTRPDREHLVPHGTAEQVVAGPLARLGCWRSAGG